MAVSSVKLIVDAANAINPLKRVAKETKILEGATRDMNGRLGDSRGRFVSTGQAATGAAKGVSKLGAAVRGLIASYGIFQASKFIIFKTAELERQTKSLEVLTGSLGNARNIIAELQQFGAVTPFTSSELIETAKRLRAFGFETNQVVDVTKRLADVAGATGADLGGVATAFGQIQAKGRLQGEELLQLQERGINLQDELQKMYTLTGDEFRKALEKGQFSAEAVELALKNLTDTGGKYANGAIAQSTTLAGKFSTLQDGIERVAQTLGAVLAPALKNILDLANQAISSINQALAAGSISTEQKQGFKSQAEAEVRRFAGSMPGGPFGAGKVVVRTNGKTYTGNASSVVSQITNDLINKEVKKQTETANAAGAGVVKPVAIGNVVPDLLNKTNGGDDGGGGAASALEAPTDDLKALQGKLDIARQLQPIQDEINASRIVGNDAVVRANETYKAQLELLYGQKNAVDALNTAEGKNIQKLINALELRKFIKDAATEESIAARAKETAIKDAMRPLEEQRQILEGTLAGRGEEVRLQLEIERILRGTPGLERAKVEELVRGNTELEKQIEQAAGLEQLYAQIGQRVADGLVEGITAAIDGTKDLQEVLSDVLKDVGKMFLQFGINSAFGSLGLPGFAEGGRPEPNRLSIVGEKGPELFIPDAPGTVLTNDQAFDAARNAMSGGNNSSNDAFADNAEAIGTTNSYTKERMLERERIASINSNPIDVRAETTVINNVEYVTAEQFSQGMKSTARDAQAKVLSDLRNRPSTRAQVGMR